MSLSSMLMAPVRGLVWVVKLPFVLVWTLLRYIGSCIYGTVAAILSVPAYYLGRVGNRLKLTWSWAKGSATRLKLSLPFTSDYTETLPHGHLKALPLAESEYNTYYLYREGEGGPYVATTRDGGSSSRRRRRSNRKTRKVIAEALTKILLESCSPSGSDEDSEAIALRSSQSEIEEREIKLILDLLKLSKSDGDPQVNPRITSQDLQALRERALNKQQLESLIAEVDQMARDVEPSVLLSKKRQRQRQSSQLSPPSSSESDELQSTKKHKTHKTSSSQSKKTSKAARDTRLDEHDQEKREHKGEGRGGDGLGEESEYSGGGAAASHHRHKYVGDLSPVQESPEYKTDEISYQELELALSRLNSEISELPDDLMEETQITHTVMVTSTKQQQLPVEEDEDSLFQDSREEFPSVPKVEPSLGLKAGHDRRNVAAARKPRPPMRKTSVTDQRQQASSRDRDWQQHVGKLDKRDNPDSEEDSWDEDSELGELDESSGSEAEGVAPSRYTRKRRPKKLDMGIELSDQLRLLSPTPKSSLQTEYSEPNVSSVLADSADVSSFYASVNKKKKKSRSVHRPRTGSDPTPTTAHSGLTSKGSSHSMTSDVGERDYEDSWKEKRSQLIPSNHPPWIEMRSSKTSESGSQPNPTPFSATSQPPWIEMRSHKNSSGHSSPASTPTTNPPPFSPLQSTTTSLAASQSTHTKRQHVHDSLQRVLPPKPPIPRPEPPPSSSGSELLLQTYSTEDEEDDEISGSNRDDSSENLYDSLQPKEEEPQRESRIFPLHEYREERPLYLHESITDSQREEAASGGSSKGSKRGSLRVKEPLPTLVSRSSDSKLVDISSAGKLKRTSSADTVTIKKEGKSREHTKQRHASSSSARLNERRGSSDSHRQRHRSSSGERAQSQRSPAERHRSSEKRGSVSSTKSSSSPKESPSTLTTMWKLLATPTSARKYQSSSSSKSDKDPSPTKRSRAERDKRSSSLDDTLPSAGSKVKHSATKASKK